MMAAGPAYGDQCSGRLTAVLGELTLTGNGEGICVVGKSDERKVLASCVVGQHCVVTGAVGRVRRGHRRNQRA
jgi:hypothetical protein